MTIRTTLGHVAPRTAAAVALSLLPLMAAAPATALDVVGYSPVVNDGFAAGYPSAPLTNEGSVDGGWGRHPPARPPR